MILVTGGTGLVGSHLLYFLLKEDAPVRAIYRESSDINAVKKVFGLYTSEVDLLFNKIEWVAADIIDIPALTEAFKNVATVYHCAATINFEASKYSLLKKINEEGTTNIVNLCLSNSVKKLCYVSSVATLGSSVTKQAVNEETLWNPDEKNNVYAITKYAAEMQVWRGTQEGLDAIVVNPGIILGTSPQDGGSSRIISLAKRGISYYPSGTMGIVDVKDVVRAMIALMNSEISNEKYVLVGENISYKDLLSKLTRLFGKKPPTKKLSRQLMYFLSTMDWLASKLFNTKRNLVKPMVRSMFKDSRYDASKIENAINFQFTHIDDTLKRVTDENK
ncbi:NAD-dependent epimerase/dehydratase family protein [Aequorivita flava]|uniref:NAD-dependent epimerase/dehydratase family protein n=1 Tax=Aequorivita flava TaxID=3114371 RepID=A0AB35YRN6_9FLAO